MNKIISYIGFAIKAKEVVIGQSQIKSSKKPINLILVCGFASDNLKDLAQNVSKKHNCECIITNVKLETLTNIKDVKIIGILNENLSKAIVENKEKIIG